MNSLELWQEGNNRFLSAALVWIRLLLERRDFDGNTPIGNEQVKEAAAEMAVASNMEPPPALLILSRRFGLSDFERDVLFLCTAMELDTNIPALCARFQGDTEKPYPTFALALSLFDKPTWDILSPARPLRYWRLIEISQHGSRPLTGSLLRADERIVSYIKGLNYLDDRLTPFLTPIVFTDTEEDTLPLSQQVLIETILNHWNHSPQAMLPVAQLLGQDGTGKQVVAVHAAAKVGLCLYRLSAGLLPGQGSDFEMLLRLWQREVRLLPLALYMDTQEIDSRAQGQPSPINRFLTGCDGAVFLDTREPWPHLERESFLVDVAKPTPTEQYDFWTAMLDNNAGDSPARLSAQFNLDLRTIRQIAQAESAETANREVTLPVRLWRACRSYSRPGLDALAQRVDTKAVWDDIVLPNEELQLLHQIAGQVEQRSRVYQTWGFAKKMNRGFGISALFAGESGTGKTMAAEVIANALALDLYRIDLSAVVNKYIGETEKNLRRLFDAAEDGGVILFFDEADALFGRRSEVKDSHDRYANIEINYLLQRIESYRGISILATNMKDSLDDGFMRRLRFIVNFPVPAMGQRKIIWQKVFPPEAPTEGLDYNRLAQFNLTGGIIHNIALNAAFLAARRGSQVTMTLIFTALRAEFRKLDRPINEGDLQLVETVEEFV